MDNDTKAVLAAAKLLHPDREIDERLAAAFAMAIRESLGLPEDGHLEVIDNAEDLQPKPSQKEDERKYRESIANILGHRECPEICVSGPAHAVSDTQASKRSPNIMAN
ncbi:hypothetical protein [Pukyongiella litopenaei]|uniref:Uncharacterized protein n=1 Tax=Pukyongiella litopenaei TaxID=2605946 RepID=A0A5C2H6K3_9RHOB|nr:hypothetical protein [Pukyongiella litopenaei]QEP30313.1 hypothetical protein C6Y53_18965 [Pukyongiella litopenaei]